MRYALAISALVIAGVLLVLGIGQRTFLAGPAEIRAEAGSSPEAAYAVLSASLFDAQEGQANIEVNGERAFMATGADRDVQAWVAPFGYDEVTTGDNDSLALNPVAADPEAVLNAMDTEIQELQDGTDEVAEGEEGEESEVSDEARDFLEPLDPRGSDLWLEERSFEEAGSGVEEDTLRLPVALAEGQSVLIATDGSSPAPAEFSIVWVQDRQTPWAGPLLVGGAFFALVGGVLYLWAFDHDRRGLGPRRGRRGPLIGIRNGFRRTGSGSSERRGSGRASRDARTSTPHMLGRIAALGLAASLGLSGCSASYWPGGAVTDETPEPTPEDTTELAPVPVTPGQIERITQLVAEVAGSADDDLDAAALEERFSGDAFDQREANYTIRESVSDYAVVPPRITSEQLDYQLVQSTEGWPRTILVTVASENEAPASEETTEPEDEDTDTEETAAPTESPSLALILRQDSPQVNFHVMRMFSLRGGVSMPQAAPAEEGTALLANDLEGLAMQPGLVGDAFAAILQDGVDVPGAELFDLADDTLLENYGKARAEKSQADSDDQDQTMKFSVNVVEGETPAVALSTGTGGALVATTLIEDQIVDSDGGRFRPQAQGAVTALSGLEGEQERIVQEVAHQILFYVPNADSGEKIQVLGVTSELIGASN